VHVLAYRLRISIHAVEGHHPKINWLILLGFQKAIFAKNGSKPKLAKVLY
jgi:hypothetical protein